MKTIITRASVLLMWVFIAVVAAVIYGIVNNQVTVTISPEYFSVFKRGQFAPMLEKYNLLNAPLRVQAALIGILATWWFGLFLGIMLGISSMIGRYAPLSTKRYMISLGFILAFTFCISAVFGLGAYVAEPLIKPNGSYWRFLADIKDVRSGFAVGWWHNGAYLGALTGTFIGSFRAQIQRRQSIATPF